jgi:hypothetical protein
MKLASPTFLYALALLVPVIIAFLVRRQRNVLKVPSTMVWRLGARSVAKSRRIRDVRRWLALAACLAGVAALALAAARPTGKAEGTHVFVVDVSSSMSGAPLEGARRWLVREVAGLGPDARVAIVRAGAEPRVTLPPSKPGPLVDDAIHSLSVESDAAAMEQAVALAEGLAAGRGRIVVLTDAPIDANVSRLDEKPAIRVFGRGRNDADNVGITSLFTRTAPDARDDEERDCSVSIATSSSVARRVHLVVTLAGRVVADRRLDVEARGEITEHVAVRGGGRLVARVSAADGKSDASSADDEAALSETVRRLPRVALVVPPAASSAGAFFVEKAIRAAGVKDLVDVDPNGQTPAGIDVAVVLADGPARPRVPSFFIATDPDEISHTRLVGKNETHLRSIATEDPLMRGVALDGVTTIRAWVPVPPPRAARSLIELDAGPVLIAGGGGARAWVWLGIEPEASDLVLRVAFPVLVANILAHLDGGAQLVSAKTSPRSEVMLAAPEVASGVPPASEPRWRVPAAPATILAAFGALLLGLEAWLTFRRKWAW